MSSDSSPSSPSPEAIADDLHALARARSLTSFLHSRHTALAELVRSLSHSDDDGLLSRGEAVRTAIMDAIARIPDERHRMAASAIFEHGALNSGYGMPLGQRQYQAAEAFNVAYDTYRRRGRMGMSLYDETIAELAVALKNVASRAALVPASREPSALRADQVVIETSETEWDGSGRLTLRMPQKAYAELGRLAEALGVSEAEVLRRALLLARALFTDGEKRVLLVDDEGRSNEIVLLW